MQSCRLVLLTAAAAPFGEQELMKRRPDGHRRQSGKKEVKASHSRTNGTKVKATHSQTVAQMKKKGKSISQKLKKGKVLQQF